MSGSWDFRERGKLSGDGVGASNRGAKAQQRIEVIIIFQSQ